MGKKWDVRDNLKATMMMVCVQVALTGGNIFYKVAGNIGMSFQVLIAYRFMFAAATVLPLALLFERKKISKITWKVVMLSFVCALFGGSMCQNLYAKSIALTSATYAAAVVNLVPAFTFILAVLFRMERLGLKSWAGKAKVIGTWVCLGGAMLLTFYKGFEINFITSIDILPKSPQIGAPNHYVSALILALCCCLASSLSLILQAKLSKIYPGQYSSTALVSVMAALQAIIYAFCTERRWTQWRLGWGIRLLSAAYLGIFSSGIMCAFTMTCVRMKGPLFISIFNPLLLLLVTVSGALFLDEKLYLGSLLGGIMILSGLYLFMWGKSKETKKINQILPSSSNSTKPIQNDDDTIDFPGNFVISMNPNFVVDLEMFESSDNEEEDEEAHTTL